MIPLELRDRLLLRRRFDTLLCRVNLPLFDLRVEIQEVLLVSQTESRELLRVLLFESGKQGRAKRLQRRRERLRFLDEIDESIRRQITARRVREIVEREAGPFHPDEEARVERGSEEGEVAALAVDVEAVVDLEEAIVDAIDRKSTRL